MQAYEFNTIIDKGNIKIPERYIGNIPSFVKVILLAEDNIEDTLNNKSSGAADTLRPRRRKQFTAMSLDTRGFKFDREEANER